MFITFIYRIENNPKTYFGKFCTDYLTDHHEGLDKEIINFVLDGVNKYRKQKNKEEITYNNIYIGIISLSWNRYVPVYSSEDEIKCFDFYYMNYENNQDDIVLYINGEPIS